ncbi:hypothetical protein I3760_08G035100 [Carya illinoinensis]|nr:hypothetical protein I3760_08G035100 [Carya illinoinensis]
MTSSAPYMNLATSEIKYSSFCQPSVTHPKNLMWKIEFCGWGAVAAEKFNKGDFIIEYIREENKGGVPL